MNDTIIKIFDDATKNEKIIDIINKQYANKEQEALAKFVKKAKQNNKYLIKNLLYSIVNEYQMQQEEKSFLIGTYALKMSTEANRATILANRYNKRKDSLLEQIHFFEYNANNFAPIIIDTKKILSFNGIFKDINIIFVSGIKYIETKIDCEKLKELTIKAYMGRLNGNDDIIDSGIIECLKEAYLSTFMQEKKLNNLIKQKKLNNLIKQNNNSPQITDISNKEDTDNKWTEFDKYIKGAKQNNNLLIKHLLHTAINEYQNYQPMAIGSCHNKRRKLNKLSFTCTFNFEDNKNNKFANQYNKEKYFTIEKVHFFKHNSNELYPIIIDVDKIHSFKNIFKSIHFKMYNVLNLDVDLEALKELTVKAYTGELKEDDDIIDSDLIESLKEAYLSIYTQEKTLNDFLEQSKKNAEKIYEEIYLKLINAYIKKPHYFEYIIPIKTIKPKYKSKEEEYVTDFERTAMIDYYDKIYYCYHQQNDGNIEYLPIQLSVLMKKLYEDTSFGFETINDYYDDVITIKFNGRLLEQFLIDNYKQELIKKHKK